MCDSCFLKKKGERIYASNYPRFCGSTLSATPKRHLNRQVLFGMTVEIQQCKGEFAQVKTFYGYEGWLPQKSLCQQKIDQWKKAQVFVSTPSLSVLSQPQVQGEILATVPRGGRLIPLDEQDGWDTSTASQWKNWLDNECLFGSLYILAGKTTRSRPSGESLPVGFFLSWNQLFMGRKNPFGY